MRLDKFLKLSRLIKRRTVANEACDAGRVSLNGKVARASAEVKAGDILVFKGHVGIAVSNSMMIDASTSKGKVVKRTSYGSYWDSRWICAYRIF